MRMIVAALALLWAAGGEGVVVDVTGGAVLGAEETSAGGRRFFAFRHVPYAGFVEGEFRFEPPKPVVPWTGTLNCQDAGPVCAQGGMGVVQGEEDCLHLSVYTPQLLGEASAKLPVLVWLPGGAFIVSGANAYDPALLMDRDVVLVVPQYRLGIYGFYYAFSEAPGNYGLLDQVAALQWVQQNIGQFGGDPSRVTLAGDCAGGASALYHMISPLSEGLFHRVLAVSGTALAPWATSHNSHRSMLVLTNYLKCARADTAAMMNCIRSQPVETLLEAQMFMLEARDLFVGNGNFAPAVQAQVVKRNESQFVLEPPVISFMEGRFSEVPVLLVTSKDVGNYILDMSLYEWMQYIEEEKELSTDEIMSIIIKELHVEEGSEAEALIWRQYFKDRKGRPNVERIPAIAQLLGDALYNTGLLHTARYLNDKVSTRILRFDFEDGPHSFYKRHPDPALAPPVPPGAGHCDELSYFLPDHHEPFTSEKQERVSQIMLDVVDDFVNAREPKTSWPTVTDEGLECIVVTSDGELTTDVFLPPDRVRAAEEIFLQQHKIELFRYKQDKEKGQHDEL
ncbi:carboxylesterase 5A-like [Hyalella azteca]|uniref:Carboxylesterase 5A-like n=1 Tax=Hyalella azteca TaxID=294128 RepID=A0A8B7P5K4_HYAAZ|nr:carboxylesterase 5A-like [Hyalella azteca]